ncbi:PQQ-binding-like beta-propeller repeat protein [Pedobacter sp. CFBP9032]|uniref:PQQ-binding-like beta-propeller repeat protein n=1 Tax=Pedobacter sp. CFBP9032 TaxID=3096539 RepID=UPI002A6AA777|nr:PQQ-binding-like beta-propeller repeat protein [Pedobacter sp. CFBP9032]MDY0905223.1 PQQ-binding-like beta-propeller repeat protein [Pedobacter sp. CFBP9032]
MKKMLFTGLVITGLYFGAFAQRQADYSSKFQTKIQSIILDNLTGNIIVKEANGVSSFNPQTNTIDWNITDEQLGKTTNMSKLIKVNDALNDPDLLKIFQSSDQLAFIENTPYIQANINSKDVIINALDGKIMFNSGTTNYRLLLSQYIPSDQKFLFLVTEGKDFKCILFDPKTSKEIWITSIGTKDGMLKSLLANSVANNMGLGLSKLTTKDEVVATSDAIYATINNHLFKLDKETGKIAWSIKENVNRFYLSNDNKHIITMRNAGSLISSKRALNALDTETGIPLFKEDIITKYISYIEDWGNKFLLAHSNGFNFFDYNTGKKIWKKDAKGDDIKQVIAIDKDYLYIADNEMSLIDCDGKQKWKNFVEISDDKADPVYFLNKIDNNKVFYLTGTYGNMVDYTTGKKIWKGNIKFDPKLPLLYAFDESNKSFLVFNDEKIYKFDPTAVEKPEPFAKIKVRNDKALSTIGLFDWGVSLSGENEVIGVGKDGSIKFKRTYKEPGAAARRLLKTGSIIGTSYFGAVSSIQGGLSEATYVVRDGSGNIKQGYLLSEASREKLQSKSILNNNISSSISATVSGRINSRFKALKQNNDFAYIFARGEGDQTNYLVKVSKATGEEVDKIAVDNTKPIYEIDYLTDNLYYVYQNELRVFSKK